MGIFLSSNSFAKALTDENELRSRLSTSIVPV